MIMNNEKSELLKKYKTVEREIKYIICHETPNLIFPRDSKIGLKGETQNLANAAKIKYFVISPKDDQSSPKIIWKNLSPRKKIINKNGTKIINRTKNSLTANSNDFILFSKSTVFL